MSMLVRRQLRLLAVALITSETGIQVESPGDWATPPSKLPSIKLRSPGDRKVSITRAMPEFTTTVTLEIMATVSGNTQGEAQDAIEDLGQQIEAAIFAGQPIVQLCQQFTSSNAEVDISADGETHIARMRMTIECETFESFEPTQLNPADYPALKQLVVNVDTAGPFDALGTYPTPPFPDSVATAPRTSGPDGRNEGTLQIDLST